MFHYGRQGCLRLHDGALNPTIVRRAERKDLTHHVDSCIEHRAICRPNCSVQKANQVPGSFHDFARHVDCIKSLSETVSISKGSNFNIKSKTKKLPHGQPNHSDPLMPLNCSLKRTSWPTPLLKSSLALKRQKCFSNQSSTNASPFLMTRPIQCK